MPADSPASPLITPDLRRRLQQRYEEAVRLLNQSPADHARVHEQLADCLRADPGNILYIDTLLANLRQWSPTPSAERGGWLGKWAAAGWKRLRGKATAPAEDAKAAADGPDSAPATPDSVLRTPYSVPGLPDQASALQILRRAPEMLLAAPNDPKTLCSLAEACAACDLDEAELRYLHAARESAPDDPNTLRFLARGLTRHGHFEETAPLWSRLLELAPDAEARQAADDLRDMHDYESDDRRLAETHAAVGENLTIRSEREELRLARGRQLLAIARRRAASDRHPQARQLVARLEAEHLRQEIEILNLRCERFTGDMRLRLELARRLKKSGNYSGAIQRLEEARSDPALVAEVLLELGECWQHLRQFAKALDIYRQAVMAAEPRPMVAALYRVGVLAAAMNQPGEARAALSRLVTIDPGYKDARERLDKLPAS